MNASFPFALVRDLLSYQLHPTFPLGWKENGAVWLQLGIIHRTERTTQDKNWTQATDSGLSQSEAFPPFSQDHSNVARECDIMLPIKGEHVHALEALCSDLWL